ncbi:MAG: phage tail tape measure protein, partial [Caulobacteraceae bacterium]|nr:phage tail tape measure protein [Caulobacteraceae bacterium]
ISDVIVKLDQSTASSGAEISDGLKRFAATAKEAGFTFEEAASMFATVSSSTRLSSETIGTAFKTFLTNLQEVKDSGPEEILMFTNKLNEVAKKYKIQIQPFDASGELRSGKDILDQVAAAYSTLTSNTERQDLVQAIAGKHQINIVQSLLANWQEYQTQVENAQTSQGAANEAQAEYNTSLIAHVNRLKNAWEEFMHTLTNSDELKSIIDFLEKMVSILTKVVDSRGLVGLILEVVGAILILKLNLSKLQASFKETKVAGETAAKATGLSWTIASKEVGLATLRMKVAFQSLLVSLKSIASQLLILNGIFGVFTGLADKETSAAEKWNKSLFSVAQIGLGLALAATALGPAGIPLMIAGLALAGVGGIGGLLTMGAASQAKKNREADALVAAQLDKQISKYAENRTAIKENIDVVEQLNDSINLTEEQTSKLNQARENLKSAMPDLVQYEDEYGNIIQRTTEQIKEQIAQNEELLRIREATRASDPEYAEQVKKDLEAAQTALDKFKNTPVPTNEQDKQTYEKILHSFEANLKEQEKIATRLLIAKAISIFPNFEDIDKTTKLFSEMGYSSSDVSKVLTGYQTGDKYKDIINKTLQGTDI